ncbi:MAG TPA: PIN domain-containing protein [Polyangiaceae bacterium]|nr:PIN domain-containing protein [Polyangiaceae bacterium]
MGKARVRTTSQGVTLDTGALIALERGDGRMIALLQQGLKRGASFRVPAGVVGQAWRGGKRQAILARFLRAREVQIVSLDEPLARACGELCRCTDTADVIDASVVLVASKHQDPVITSDPEDLRRLAPRSTLLEV